MNPAQPGRPALTRKQALEKMEHYCAYQERSQQEVRDKLYSLELRSADIEEIIAELIQNNFLNEERFAVAYAQGKFRMKNWGKLKIKQGLKLKRVSDKLITKALNQIDGDDYYQVLTDVIEKKSRFINEKEPIRMRHKLFNYAVSRGFENDLILEVLKNRGLA